jgi:hypothetical protein
MKTQNPKKTNTHNKSIEFLRRACLHYGWSEQNSGDASPVDTQRLTLQCSTNTREKTQHNKNPTRKLTREVHVKNLKSKTLVKLDAKIRRTQCKNEAQTMATLTWNWLIKHRKNSKRKPENRNLKKNECGKIERTVEIETNTNLKIRKKQWLDGDTRTICPSPSIKQFHDKANPDSNSNLFYHFDKKTVA